MAEVMLFACIEKNIGDDLFVYIVCNRYPDSQFTITSDADYGDIAELENLKFSRELKRWLWASSIGEKNILKRIIGIILEKVFELKIKKCETAVYIVGNAFKNLDYIGKSQTRWIRERVKLTEYFYLMSTNFGPFADERWVNDCSEVFMKMTDVCFRDKESYSYFANLDNVRCAPDAVFSLGKRVNIPQKILLMSVIDFSLKDRNKKLHSRAGIYEEKMLEIAEGYISEGYKIILLNSNSNQDRDASRRIGYNVIKKENIQIIDYDGNLESIFNLFESAELVIATRLHTIVLAFLYGIPVIPIEYDIKVTNLLNMCGFDGYKASPEDMDKLSYSFVKKKFSEYSFVLPNEIIERAEAQFERLDKQLKI